MTLAGDGSPYQTHGRDLAVVSRQTLVQAFSHFLSIPKMVFQISHQSQLVLGLKNQPN